jgi:hypothetical protein
VSEIVAVPLEFVWAITYQGILAARVGDRESARASLDALNQLGRNGTFSSFFEGFVMLALYDSDGFFLEMHRALEKHSLPVLELLYSPLLESARGGDRFAQLMERQRQQADSASTGQ